MELCVMRVCGKDPYGLGTTPDGLDTTLSSDVKKPTTPKMTQLERQIKRLKDVQNSLKSIQNNLTTMCWETSLGQELSKVIVFDGVR